MEQLINGRIRLEVREGLAWVRLSRPDKFNGLDWDMLQGLAGAACAIRRHAEVRAVILHLSLIHI